MIQVKDIHVLDSLTGHEYHWKLRELSKWIYGRHKRLCITEGYRPSSRVGDIHSTKPCRAMDLRSWIFKNPRKVRDDINNNWEYDPQRPEFNCCRYHRVKRGGWHFHCQVCQNTRVRV